MGTEGLPRRAHADNVFHNSADTNVPGRNHRIFDQDAAQETQSDLRVDFRSGRGRRRLEELMAMINTATRRRLVEPRRPRRTPDGVKFGVKRRRPAKDPRKNNWDNPTEQDLPRRKATKFNYIYGTNLPKRKATIKSIEAENKRREQTRLLRRAEAKKLAEAKRLAARPTILGPRAEAESSSLDSSPSDSSEVIPDDEPKPSILPGWVTDAWKKLAKWFP